MGYFCKVKLAIQIAMETWMRANPSDSEGQRDARTIIKSVSWTAISSEILMLH